MRCQVEIKRISTHTIDIECIDINHAMSEAEYFFKKHPESFEIKERVERIVTQVE